MAPPEGKKYEKLLGAREQGSGFRVAPYHTNPVNKEEKSLRSALETERRIIRAGRILPLPHRLENGVRNT
jgi:hypothetical protein